MDQMARFMPMASGNFLALHSLLAQVDFKIPNISHE